MIIAVFSFIYFYLGFSFSEFFSFIVFAVLVSFPMFDKILPHTGHERRNFFKRIFNHSKMVTRYLVLLVLSASYGSGALRHLKLKGDESVVISSGVVDLEISIVLSLSNGFLGYQYDGMLPGYVYVSEARELIAR